VSLLTNPVTSPTFTTSPATKTTETAKKPYNPFAGVTPIDPLKELYNVFKPPQFSAAPSQTDTGPIQLMTDIFGTDISQARKTGARGYGFSAGGDIDELLRFLRS
jgi:hypothetical protein